MQDFELSIKSRPGGSVVTVTGSGKQVLVQFALLAAAISKHSGLPLDLLAAAVMGSEELSKKVVDKSISFDMTKLRRAGEK